MATSVKGTTHSSTHGNGAVRHYKAKTKSLAERLPFLSEDTEEQLNDLATVASKVSKRYLKIGRQYIKDNPITGVVIASSVGFIAGSLFSMVVRKRI